MTPHLMPILAADWAEVVVSAIGVIIVVGSMVANALSKQKQKQAPGDVIATGGDPAESRRKRLEEMATRRREQLRQLQGRRQEPQNLTVGQAEERSRAKTLYERRAEALRRQLEQQPTQRQVPEAPPQTADAQMEARRQAQAQAEAKARAEAQARAAAEARARQQQEEQRRQAEAAARRQEADLARQRQARKSRLQRQRAAMPQQAAPANAAHVTMRSEAAAAQPAEELVVLGPADLQAAVREQLRGPNLRQAILLREILGRPVGLRDREPGSASL